MNLKWTLSNKDTNIEIFAWNRWDPPKGWSQMKVRLNIVSFRKPKGTYKFFLYCKKETRAKEKECPCHTELQSKNKNHTVVNYIVKPMIHLLPVFLSLLFFTTGFRRTPQMSHADMLPSLSYVQMEQRQTSGLSVSRFDSSALPVKAITCWAVGIT